jgi:DNA repair photolyase
MNDPYMPVEGRLKLTRGALKLLSQYAFPVHIITKGTLVYRDVDILQEIGKTYSAVTLTITTSKDDLSRKIEPGAPPSSSRLRALRLLRDRGILAGVIISPILPWISDQVRDLEKLIRLCRDAGTSYVLFWPWMTLRKGQRSISMVSLTASFRASRGGTSATSAADIMLIQPRVRYCREKCRC